VGDLTNNKDRMVEIDVGLDGRIPQPGYIIGLGDERLAGRVNGGRISAVNGRVITLDRDIDAKPGDRLHLNLPSGISQAGPFSRLTDVGRLRSQRRTVRHQNGMRLDRRILTSCRSSTASLV
jgi:predicted phage tail protein